jgi:hypothetical protein
MEGGLRLDERKSAQAGGVSGQTLLSRSLETNPLYVRITSTNPDERMPLAADPLSEKDIDTIARWIQQGPMWPETASPLPPASQQSKWPTRAPGFLGWIVWVLDLGAEAARTYGYLKNLAIFAVVLLLATLVIEVFREARKKERPWTKGKLRPIVSVVCMGRLSYTVVLLLGTAIFFVWQDFHQKLATLGQERDQLRKRLALASAPSNDDVYGTPPVPNRPNKSKEISGTYYRGNCERNAKLFNGGNYRTATFHLSVVDADKKKVNLGDSIKDGPVFIHFEIERAPKTAPEFFKEKTTDKIYLTENHVKYPPKTPPSSKPVCLETIEPEQRWGGDYSIGNVPGGNHSTASGLIYIVVGTPNGDVVSGQIHYGIRYDLIFEDHKIVEGSDLWMGELMITPPIAPPRRDKIPLHEWFDYRPIPEITGENTKDPKLLGIDANPGD